MGELFELICKKEKLKASEHQLSVPKIGGRKVTFDSHTAVGSLKVREVSIIETGLSKKSASCGSVDLSGNVEEINSLETMSEEVGDRGQIQYSATIGALKNIFGNNEVCLDIYMYKCKADHVGFVRSILTPKIIFYLLQHIYNYKINFPRQVSNILQIYIR